MLKRGCAKCKELQVFPGLDSSAQRLGEQEEGPDAGQMCRRRTWPQPECRTSPGPPHQGWEQECVCVG